MTAKNSRSSKDIALDKFDVDITAGSKKKSSKIPKQKNPIKRFAAALFPQSGDTKAEIIRKTLLLAAIAMLIGTVAFLVWQITVMNNSGKNSQVLANSANAPYESLPPYVEPAYVANPPAIIATTAGTEEPEFIDLTPVVNTPLNVDFNYLKRKNPDTVGWIKITDTLVNNVVMQRPGDDDYYLDHDFYGNESFSGEVFSSWRNKWDGTDDNIILFGHKMNSGYFFGQVVHYVPNDVSSEPLAFYKVHPTIMLQRDGGPSETYKIFAGIVVNTDPAYGEVFSYTTKTQFTDKDDFNNYIIEIMDRSWFYTDVDIQYGDQLLTLSTCYWPLGKGVPTRFALIARKVRPGESEYVDTSVAKRNWGAKLFEYYYQVLTSALGSRVQWNGSDWDTSKLLSY